jgi:protein-tyrosine phosphatase
MHTKHGEKMKYKIYDIHAHIAPGVDDGCKNIDMSMDMLKIAYAQGARSIVCTSHSGCDVDRYYYNLKLLQDQAKKEGIDIILCPGCEIYCSYNNIESVICGLDNGKIPTINKTKYVLIEFNPYVPINEIMCCVKQLHEHNYKTIIAHVERYYNLHSHILYMQMLRDVGCLFQINAYSLKDESNKEIVNFARKILAKLYVTFVGSDAHRTDHRAYAIENGIDYIYTNCTSEYADNICFKNAKDILNITQRDCY